MRRSDGTNLAIGGILVGISAVMLGLLSPAAAVAVAGVCGILGLYVIVGGVYLGWWTPATAVERALQPNLRDAEAEVFLVQDKHVFFQIGVYNSGRDNLDGAHLNVIVPEFVSEMHRCTVEGKLAEKNIKERFGAGQGTSDFGTGLCPSQAGKSALFSFASRCRCLVIFM
jgi:hypothetical protein